jgi:hypothetical protein
MDKKTFNRILDLSGQLNENLSHEDVFKRLIRGYRLNEIQKEISKIEETSDERYSKEEKADIIEQLKKLLRSDPTKEGLTFLNIIRDVDNTDNFREYLKINKTPEDSFPPPIVVEKKGRKRLIGGNKEIVRTNLEADKSNYGNIPVIILQAKKAAY